MCVHVARSGHRVACEPCCFFLIATGSTEAPTTPITPGELTSSIIPRRMKGLSPLLLALLAAPLCSALVVGAAARAPLQRIAPACTMVEADATSQFLDDLEEAAVDDPLGDSEFVRWYRFEKAKEKYDKENPRDVVGEAAEKLKGPVTSLAILGGGFYAIPLGMCALSRHNRPLFSLRSLSCVLCDDPAPLFML